jgi:hypothetical protein
VLWGAKWPFIADSGYRMSGRDLYAYSVFAILGSFIFGAIFLSWLSCLVVVVLCEVAMLVATMLR